MRRSCFLAVLGLFLIMLLHGSGMVIAEDTSGKIPITSDSDDAVKLFLKGRDLTEKLRFQEGRKFFDKAIKVDPEFALAYLYAANNSVTFNEYFDYMEKAKANMDQISDGEKLLIKRSLATFDGDQKAARDILLKLVQLYPDDERAAFSLGGNYGGQQEYEKAVELYKRTIAINPEFAPVYNSLGYLYRTMGNYDEAEQAFKKYIDLIPDDPNPYDSYAELLLKEGKYDESIEQYRMALKKDKYFSISRFGIATNLCLMGDPDGARKQIDTAYTLARDDGEKRAALAASGAICMDAGKMKDALTAYKKMYNIAKEANDILTMGIDLRNIGYIKIEDGKYDDAMADFTAARDLIVKSTLEPTLKDQFRASYLADMAEVYARMGKFDEARANADEYMKYATENNNVNLIKFAHQINGYIAMEQGDYKTAIKELEQANHQNPYHLYRLGLAYKGAGNMEKASEYLEKAADFHAVNSLNYNMVRRKAEKMLAEL